MCGIVGGFGWTSGDVLGRMLSCIEHRGPDEEGTYVDHDSHVMLGARRLSIIDLQEGSQPITNEDGSIVVVFNGEIYNHSELREELNARGHRFETSCDTEVLVHLWEEYGVEMCEHLDGMFAFAMWDSEAETVFLARDRLGIKPLYHAKTDRGHVWASELPALLEADVDRTLDERAVYNYFSLRYSPGPETLLSAVKKVRPGSGLLLSNDGSIEHQNYWSVPTDPVQTKRSTATQRVRDGLERSVQRRLMSDVPLGAFLSGGLDSAAIVGLARRHSAEPIATFSVGFQADEFDESDEARFVADHFGTDHHETVVDLDSMDVFGDVIRRFGEPLADPAVLPTAVLSTYASDSVKVVLTGEGSDELFAGYDFFRRLPRHRRRFERLPNSAFAGASIAAKLSPVGWKYLRYLSSLESDESAILEWIRGYGTRPEQYLDSTQTPETSGLRRNVSECVSDDADTLHNLSRYYIEYWLPDDLLYKVDHTSMAASLEARVPFLDHQLVEFVANLPADLKLRGGSYKPLLSAAVDDVVPQRTLQRSKHGFRVPIARWFREDHPAIARWLDEESVVETPYVTWSQTDRLLTEHKREQADHRGALWKTLNYVTWYHTHVHS